jgi:uncharacterized protein YndB with AHSA1/START domain
MERGSIERELHVAAPPEVVFEVISTPQYIQQWWSAETAFAPVAGATSSLTWTDAGTGAQQTAPFTVVEVVPPQRFSFRWTYDGDIGIPGNSLLVTFDLIPTAGGTTVRFSETGYRERGWEAAVLEAHYDDHRQGWDFLLPRVADLADQLATAQ